MNKTAGIMIKFEDVYKIGKINKPHGVDGELLFTFTDDVFDRADAKYIICNIDGILVPFFIEEYRFRTDSSVLLKLEDVDDIHKAREFTNIDVYLPKSMIEDVDGGMLSWDFFVGFEAVDTVHGVLGHITHVDSSTVNVLFYIETSAGMEIAVPAHEDMIKEIDRECSRIVFSLPEGLIDVNLVGNESD